MMPLPPKLVEAVEEAESGVDGAIGRGDYGPLIRCCGGDQGYNST